MKKYYVTMNDTFMSGWGRAENKINKLIFECDSYKEAEIVADNARYRGDMKYININHSKPRYSGTRYLVQEKTKADYPNWYVPNYFYKH